MKTFLAVAAGLSFVLGSAVYAQVGGATGDKSKVAQKAPAKVEKAKAKENKKKNSAWDWGNFKKKAEAPKAK